MIEGGDGPRLAVEALQRGGIVGLGGGQHLDGHPAAHEFVLAEEDAAHAAGAEPLQHLVLADGEAPPFPEHELLGLEMRQQAFAAPFFRRVKPDRWAALGAEPLQVGVELLVVEHAALANQVQKFVDRRRRRHQPSSRTRDVLFAHPTLLAVHSNNYRSGAEVGPTFPPGRNSRPESIHLP